MRRIHTPTPCNIGAHSHSPLVLAMQPAHMRRIHTCHGPQQPHVSITLQHRCAFAQSTSTGNAAGPYAPYPYMPRPPKPHVSIITAPPILYHLPGAPSTGKLPNPRTGQRRPAGPFLLLSRSSWASREVTRLPFTYIHTEFWIMVIYITCS